MYSRIRNPWKKEFLKLVKGSKKSIKIAAPFVKENICRDIFAVKKETTDFALITSFKLPNAYGGSLDLAGLDLILQQGGIVKNYPQLHAKIYIFDEEKAVVTSGNLTNGGLIHNFEYGLFIEEMALVSQINSDFERLSFDKITGVVKSLHIEKAREILRQMPKSTGIKIPNFSIETSDTNSILSQDFKKNILLSLTGWKLEVFRCLDNLDNQEFSLQDAYAFENHLQLIYPRNNHVKDKIRQQIQSLRDLGLIEFLTIARYKKLW